jgi:hypothetical protein
MEIMNSRKAGIKAGAVHIRAFAESPSVAKG